MKCQQKYQTFIHDYSQIGNSLGTFAYLKNHKNSTIIIKTLINNNDQNYNEPTTNYLR